MKKTKKRIFLLTSIFLFLILIILVKDSVIQILNSKKETKVFNVQKDDIHEMTLQNDSTTFQLIKNNNSWVVRQENIEFPADQQIINQILDAIIQIEKGDVVSTNKNKHKELGIGPKKIIFKTPQSSHSIYIGNTSGLNSNLVRLNEENEVFVTSNLDSVLFPGDYRDLSFKLVNNEQNVKSVIVTSDGLGLILNKKDGNWTINEQKANREQVDFFINDLKILKATDLVKNEGILIEPIMTIKVKENNKEKTAEFFYKDEEDYFAKVSNSNYLYVIPIATVDSLKKEENEFIQ